MNSKSFAVQNVQDINTQLEQITSDGFKPTVAIVLAL